MDEIKAIKCPNIVGVEDQGAVLKVLSVNEIVIRIKYSVKLMDTIQL